MAFIQLLNGMSVFDLIGIIEFDCRLQREELLDSVIFDSEFQYGTWSFGGKSWQPDLSLKISLDAKDYRKYYDND